VSYAWGVKEDDKTILLTSLDVLLLEADALIGDEHHHPDIAAGQVCHAIKQD
jgi:hypothetical protein